MAKLFEPTFMKHADMLEEARKSISRHEVKKMLFVIEGLSIREGRSHLNDAWQETWKGTPEQKKRAEGLITEAVRKTLAEAAKANKEYGNYKHFLEAAPLAEASFHNDITKMKLLSAADESAIYSARDEALRTAYEGIRAAKFHALGADDFLKNIIHHKLDRASFIIEQLSVRDGMTRMNKTWQGSGEHGAVIRAIADCVCTALDKAQEAGGYDSYEQFGKAAQLADGSFNAVIAPLNSNDKQTVCAAREVALATAFAGTRIVQYYDLITETEWSGRMR